MKRYLTISAWLVILVVALGCRKEPSVETEKKGPEPNAPARVDTKVVEPKQEAEAAADEVAVTVNGRVVTEGQLEAEIEKVAPLMQPGYLENNRDRVRKQALDRLIISRLLEEEIKEAKIVAAEEEVVEQIREIPAQQFLSLDEFKTILQTRGIIDAIDITEEEEFVYVTEKDVLDHIMEGGLEHKLYWSEFKMIMQTRRIINAIEVTEKGLYVQISEGEHELSLDEFKAVLKTRGMNFDEWKQQMQFELKIQYQKLIEAKMGDQINVTETDANNFYSANIQRFQVTEQVKASHILIKPDNTDPNADPNEAKAKALAKAQDLLKQLKEGADFTELVKAHSQSPSAVYGKGKLGLPGVMGFFSRGRMVPAFEDAAFALKVNEVSDVVETQFGYHIIKVTDRIEAGARKFQQVKDSIMKMLKQQKQVPLITKYIESLKAQAKIVYPPGKEPPLVPIGP